MEELQEALKGKNDSNLMCVLHERVESLAQNYMKQRGSYGKQYLLQEQCSKFCASDPNQTGLTADVRYHSPQTRNKESIEEFSLDNYLNLRRHSIGSVTELTTETGTMQFKPLLKNYSTPNLNDDHYSFYTTDDVQNADYRYFDSFVLSPIEEYSEISTRNNSLQSSREFAKRSNNALFFSSYSCSFLTTKTEDDVVAALKYQTFPRSKVECSFNSYESLLEGPHKSHNRSDMSRFPLAPREIDPAAYYQLHTADSQEELQEFLLLESACMNDNKGPGLAAAFSKKNCN